MTNATLRGKPDAGNPHVRFDEGEAASDKPRRGSPLCKAVVVVLLSALTLQAAPGWRLPVGELKPIKAENVTFEKGPLGETAVHLPTNGVLRYKMPKEWCGVASNGTACVWFKQDWTPVGSALYCDRDKDFNGDWTCPTWKSVWLRTLVLSGQIELGGGIFGVTAAGLTRSPI